MNNKCCIITGAAGGIGLGVAGEFVERGAKVIIADRDQTAGAAAAEQLGDAAHFVHCDVADEASVNVLVATSIETLGQIDVLVNNAGVNFVKAFDQMTTADWDHVMSVDLRGVFLMTRACIEHFLAQGGGSVVNIASVHTLACVPGAAPYDAAKWGVVGMSKALAVEYADRNIRFNCVSPGLIDTQIWRDLLAGTPDKEACMDHWRANIPAGRVGSTREIAKAVAFLAGDDAGYITGANLVADGGMTSQLISRETYDSEAVEGR